MANPFEQIRANSNDQRRSMQWYQRQVRQLASNINTPAAAMERVAMVVLNCFMALSSWALSRGCAAPSVSLGERGVGLVGSRAAWLVMSST